MTYIPVNPQKLEFGILRDGKLFFSAVSFCHFASQVTKCCNAKALDSLRRFAIGNASLVSKAGAATERSRHCPKAAGKVVFSPSLR